MMHVNNKTEPDLSTLEGRRNPSAKYPDRETIRLAEEELRVYKKCSNESFLKAGLPFAVFCDVVKNFMTKKQAYSRVEGMFTQGDVGPLDATSPLGKSLNVKRGLIFIGNIIFGSFLYIPVCYQRLKEFHEANERKRMLEKTQGTIPFEGTNVKTQPEDFSYPTDLVTNLSDDSSFSDDFNTSKFILEEDDKPKIPQTTYDDLRVRNRERQGINRVPNASESTSRLSTPPEPALSSEPPPRRVKRNKYGDEME